MRSATTHETDLATIANRASLHVFAVFAAVWDKNHPPALLLLLLIVPYVAAAAEDPWLASQRTDPRSATERRRPQPSIAGLRRGRLPTARS